MSRSRHLLRLLLPAAPLARARLVALTLAIAAIVAMVPSIVMVGEPATLKVGALAAGLTLAAHWVIGYRRDTFAPAGEVLELVCLYALLAVAPGEPFLPLFGLVFRSFYGGAGLAVLRYAMWSGALVVGHAPRGVPEIRADLGHALSLAVVPAVAPMLRAALERLEASERRLASLVQNSTDVVTVIDAGLTVLWQAASIRSVLGHEPRAIRGTSLLELVHPEDATGLQRQLASAGERPGASFTLALRLRHRDGAWRHFEIVASNRRHDPTVGGFVLNMRDATDRERLERDLRSLVAQREHDAMHDPLTGLANRRRLFSALDAEIAYARYAKSSVALLMVDLDRFKELNDTLGHAAGDQLLRELQPRLLAGAPDAELIARLGGDEFAVVLRTDSIADAERTAVRLRAAIEESFRFRGLTLFVGASIGIATFPREADSVDTLVQRADIAMYSAKRRGVGHELYDPARDDHCKERLALLGELPGAIARRELVVHYQPKVDLPTGRTTGVEALVRWEHPERGLLGPGAFVPLAEQTGLMRPLTLQVLESALEQCARWEAQGLSLSVAVNLAAPNLLDAGLPGDVDRMLKRFGVDPSLLQLEITETIIAADPVRVGEIVGQLRALGVTLSLDDFGTGSSSLSYLRRLPVQELKIDKSFVLKMDDDEQDATVVRAIIDLAHNLGLRAVAEGIETQAVLDRLRAYGCDDGQGFLLGRPMPADEVTEVIVGQAPAPSRRLVAA